RVSKTACIFWITIAAIQCRSCTTKCKMQTRLYRGNKIRKQPSRMCHAINCTKTCSLKLGNNLSNSEHTFSREIACFCQQQFCICIFIQSVKPRQEHLFLTLQYL